jgi:aminocarboxymuconate-semialdehyde decarboxylase
MLIDMHAHVIPGEFPPAGTRPRWPAMELASDGTRKLQPSGLVCQPVCWDIDARRAAMAANGVDAEVVSPMPGLLGYAFSPADGLELCRHANAFITELCARDPQRLYGIGILPMQDPSLAAAELSDVKRSGLYGVEIASNVNGVSLGDERFVDFFREAEAQDLAIFVHGLAPTFGDRYPQSAGGGFGVAAEIAVGAISLVASGLLDKCPKLRVALSHGAGGFPLMLTRAQFFWGRTWNEEPPADGKSFETSPAAQARRFFYDSLVFDQRALRYLVDMLGTTQLLIGTDHPFMQREQPVGKTLRSLGLSADAMESITWHNCFRWLGIAEPALSTTWQTAATTIC